MVVRVCHRLASAHLFEIVELMLLEHGDDLIDVVLDPLQVLLNYHPLFEVNELPPGLLVIRGRVNRKHVLVLILPSRSPMRYLHPLD